MARPRKHSAAIPAHIDQARLPPGIYWDNSGSGRWYVRDARPDGGTRATSVANRTARLSDLFAIVERRAGGPARDTVAHVLAMYHDSSAYKALEASTRSHYDAYRAAICAYPTSAGRFGDLVVDRLTPPDIRTWIDRIAFGQPARGAAPAVPAHPTKANHWLRYLRARFAWGIQYSACKTNPAAGVKCVREVRAHRMPSRETFRAVQAFARTGGALAGRTKGALPAYLWAAMELAYQSRLRGIEVLTLTDAHVGAGEDALHTNRRKGSRDNLVRKGALLGEAIAALQAYRNGIWAKKKCPVPMRPSDRVLFVGEDGQALTKDGFDTAFGRMMRSAVRAGVITAEDRFGLHALKHRGITDTAGNRATKKDAAGHVTDSMVHVYDHELLLVEPADDPARSKDAAPGLRALDET